jgi:hypothetical protein
MIRAAGTRPDGILRTPSQIQGGIGKMKIHVAAIVFALLSIEGAPVSAATRVVTASGDECRHVWRDSKGAEAFSACTINEYRDLRRPPTRPGFTWVKAEIYTALNTPEKTVRDGDAIEEGGGVTTLLNGKIYFLPEAFVSAGRVQSARTYEDVEITAQGDIVEKVSETPAGALRSR